MSISQEIRRVLLDAEEPLSVSQIREALTVECQNLPSALRERVLAGEFVRHHSTAGLRYSLNPEWSPKKRGAPPHGAKANPPSAKTAKVPAKPLALSPQDDVQTPFPEVASAYHAPAATSPAIAKRSDFDLRRRLDAIGADLADAIADACDAEHPHGLIKALVVSREAVVRAQAALPR